MVDVVEPSSSHRPWLDGARESAGHEPGDELPAVLARGQCPLKAQYCRSRKQPEWTITVTRNSRCRSVKPKPPQGVHTALA